MSTWLKGDPVPAGPRRWFKPRPYRFAAGAAYSVTGFGGEVLIEIPADFIFDNSAPWWLAWALPRRRMRRATGLHDYARRDPAWTLWFGNLLFVDAMKADGVREPFLTVCWWAVRTNRNRAAPAA